MNPDFIFHAADEFCATGTGGNQPGHRFAMFRDDDSLGVKMIQQHEALLLELGSVDYLHGEILILVKYFVQTIILSILWRTA